MEAMTAPALAQQVCGAPVEVEEVLEHTIWHPNVLVAERFGADRVFLAGDACHEVIPTGGYGMNTGVAVAVDIGWKLAVRVDMRTPTERALVADWARAEPPGAAGAAMRS
jgi:2-polyprenyl-6-methoxyphenol hydroxylase-like FAD-dependent oxidoreductase